MDKVLTDVHDLKNSQTLMIDEEIKKMKVEFRNTKEIKLKINNDTNELHKKKVGKNVKKKLQT